MELVELRNYRKWVGKSPTDILMDVVRCGGWEAVFDTGLPRWAHRLRNYFNVAPRKLQRLDTGTANLASRRVKKFEFAVGCARVLEHRLRRERGGDRVTIASMPN